MKYQNLFETLTPDPIGRLLGTGFNRFTSRYGISGLALESVDKKRLDILAVFASNPGHGQFREFIKAAKSSYNTVCVWHIWNQKLIPVLERYGFTKEVEISGGAEVLDGMRWDRPKNEQRII